MASGSLSDRWDVRPFDNARTAPPNRTLLPAIAAHLVLLARLAGAVIRHRPALVHVHTCSYRTFFRSMADVVVARLLWRPVILHVHGGYFHEFLSSLHGWKRRLALANLRLAALVIVLGRIWRQRLEDVVPPERIRVVPNAVHLPPQPRILRRRKPLRIICVGDLAPGKAPEDLIEAVARLSPALRARTRVELIGDGSPARWTRIVDLIAREGLQGRVKLAGRLTPEQTQSRWRRADVHVLPSHGEGLPMALLEAMAWGLPSVVTGVGAIPEAVSDGVEAYVIEPGNVNALADRLARLLADDAGRFAMGRAARRRAWAAFNIERFHKDLNQVWRELIPAEGPLPTPAP
jgi:glycosyltransferase involved in cell wall biosynthesis